MERPAYPAHPGTGCFPLLTSEILALKARTDALPVVEPARKLGGMTLSREISRTLDLANPTDHRNRGALGPHG